MGQVAKYSNIFKKIFGILYTRVESFAPMFYAMAQKSIEFKYISNDYGVHFVYLLYVLPSMGQFAKYSNIFKYIFGVL